MLSVSSIGRQFLEAVKALFQTKHTGKRDDQPYACNKHSLGISQGFDNALSELTKDDRAAEFRLLLNKHRHVLSTCPARVARVARELFHASAPECLRMLLRCLPCAKLLNIKDTNGATILDYVIAESLYEFDLQILQILLECGVCENNPIILQRVLSDVEENVDIFVKMIDILMRYSSCTWLKIDVLQTMMHPKSRLLKECLLRGIDPTRLTIKPYARRHVLNMLRAVDTRSVRAHLKVLTMASNNKRALADLCSVLAERDIQDTQARYKHHSQHCHTISEQDQNSIIQPNQNNSRSNNDEFMDPDSKHEFKDMECVSIDSISMQDSDILREDLCMLEGVLLHGNISMEETVAEISTDTKLTEPRTLQKLCIAVVREGCHVNILYARSRLGLPKAFQEFF